MQRVDEEAVGEDSAPGAEQGRGADPVRIAADERISESGAEREEQQHRKREEPGETLLREHPHVRAVRGDRRDLLELTGPGAERILLGCVDPDGLGSEALRVVALRTRPLGEEAATIR